MGSNISLLYLSPDGRYRERSGERDDKFVLNHSDRQAHTLGEGQVFTPNAELVLGSLTELATMPPPEEDLRRRDKHIVVEDFGIVPLSPEGHPLPDMVRSEVLVADQVTKRRAGLATSQDMAREAFYKAIGFAFVGLGTFVVAIVGLVVVANEI